MTTSGTIKLREVWRMLEICAPGYTKQERVHHWCVRYKGSTFPSLPKGAHGARYDPEIQAGKVKQMVRQLEIEDCAAREIPRLR